MPFAISLISKALARNPVFLCSIISDRPPILKATTGTPHAWASNATSGRLSCLDGTITTSNYSYTNEPKVNYRKEKTSEVRHLETGRVEKGSNSNQTFTYDNSSFNSYPTKTNWWKIKPNSTKVLVKEDLVVYCTECGSKRKKDNHKFVMVTTFFSVSFS